MTTSSDPEHRDAGEDVEEQLIRAQSRAPPPRVTSRLTVASGSSTFQPNDISWS